MEGEGGWRGKEDGGGRRMEGEGGWRGKEDGGGGWRGKEDIFESCP